MYLLISDMSDFDDNFREAWSQRRTTEPSPNDNLEQEPRHFDGADGQIVNRSAVSSRRKLSIFVESRHLDIAVLYDGMNDTALLEQLQMFYRYLKIKRGLVELIIPTKLVKINCVKVS